MSTMIQIIFAEKFVTQDFTIRALSGLSGPTNTCEETLVKAVALKVHELELFKEKNRQLLKKEM